MESDLILCVSPAPQTHTGHVRVVDVKCMLSNLLSLAPPCLVGGVRYLPCPRASTLGDPGKWGYFPEPVCLRRYDHRDLNCSRAGGARGTSSTRPGCDPTTLITPARRGR